MTETQPVPVLECENLSVSYVTRAGEVPAVTGFDLKVAPGEAVGLVGESGCGKSTVALAVMNYLGRNGRIVDGAIRFAGRDLTTLSPEELRLVRGSEIAMVYQEPMASLNPAMRVGHQLAEVLLFHGVQDAREVDARVRAMLEGVRLPDPDRVIGSYPHQLSGGQQQRVVIAMALLARPNLLLLDEPTTALDVTVEAGIIELIRDLARSSGTSLLFISHNLGLILETCDRLCVMYAGEAVEEGPVSEIFDQCRHPYTRGLFRSIPLPAADRSAKPLVPIAGHLPLPTERPAGCRFGPRCPEFVAGPCGSAPIGFGPVAGYPQHRSRCARIDAINWQRADNLGDVTTPVLPGQTVLQVDKLQKHYPVGGGWRRWFGGGGPTMVKANEAVDLDAREAETVALVGESGCGKTTFAKVLMGLEEATSGKALLDGRDLAHLAVQDRDRALVGHLQMVFQNPFDTLNPSRTVGKQIARTLRRFGVAKSRAEAREQALQLLDKVELPRAFYDRRPRQLSGGQKQRVGIARAFAGAPKLVVADEPVSALDVSVQAAVTQLLDQIQREHRTTLLVISHDLALVRYLADRVFVMYLGRVVESGTTQAVFAPPYHPYTEALLSAVPVADTTVEKRRIVLEGELPSALSPPSGCPFHTRCPRKVGPICEQEEPPEVDLGRGHRIRCHLAADALATMQPVFATKAA